MKLWIHLLYSSLLACISSQSQSPMPSASARGSCDSLCNCEEKDGTMLINCEEKGIKKLSQISVPPSRPFHLSLLNNGLTVLHTNDFSGLTNAISIHLGFNNIADIETGAFNGLGLLKQLHINHNSLEILKEDTFHGLENLEFLQADNNFITVIEPSAFSKLNRLKVLILNDNAIESLPPNIFRFVPLTHLDLRGNQLQTLPYVGFLEHIGRILDLQLEDNKWACNCDLLQLKLWLENMPPQSVIGDVVCNSPPFFKGSILSRLKKESICPTPPVYEEHEDPSGSLHLAVTSSISDSHMSAKTTSFLKPPTKAPGLIPYITKPSTQLPGLYCPIPCNCKVLSPSGLLIHCQERNIESLSDLKPPPQNPRKLILAGNIIHTLLKSDLVEYFTLEMLHLGNNRIEVLEEGSFMNLTRLQKLYLNGNHLTKLSGGIVVLVLHRRRRYKKKQADEQMRDTSPVHLQYSMYGHKTTHHTTERPTASLYEQHMVSPMVHVYRSPSFGPKHLEEEEERNEKEGSDAKHLQRSLLERENHSPLTGSNMKYKTTDQSTEFLTFQDASSLYRNILEKERELQQLGITEYLRKNIAQLQPDTEVHYPGAHEELKLMETLLYSRPRKVLVEQTKNEYFELKANLHAEPDYLEVLEQQT
ncbi:PREDICTED: SLIT and NTRK-like protein 6 isoform X2 [Bison bison bison]|uniref:SLIT and NTRK-like protein 6 isoform X2 n=1 Tax=Bison bison bison TaxID=43346 RepID=A0A6P3IF09_BISBB|nr:PREDICTED: SLIT and NTRK-like protein 6 isoform X2 [Bison bison bison]